MSSLHMDLYIMIWCSYLFLTLTSIFWISTYYISSKFLLHTISLPIFSFQARLDVLGRILTCFPIGHSRYRAASKILYIFEGYHVLDDDFLPPEMATDKIENLRQSMKKLLEIARACLKGEAVEPWKTSYRMVSTVELWTFHEAWHAPCSIMPMRLRQLLIRKRIRYR